jgi:hypothetical protein
MTNKELFKQAIAEAKTIREAALVNAKAALEETLTPHLQSMLASKLEEMAKDEDEDVVKEMQDADTENGEELKEEEISLDEEFNLDEFLAELELEEGSDDEINEAKDEESEEETEEPTEDEESEEGAEGEEEETSVADLSIEDLKDIIKDIVDSELEAEEAETEEDENGEEMEMNDAGNGDDSIGLDGAGSEDEINLEELLAELDALDEEKSEEDENMQYEAKKAKKDEKELDEAVATIETLRAELNEVNLLNAKLLYVNKIFKAKNLSEDNKIKVINAFDKATTPNEAKLVFEALNESLEAKESTKSVVKEGIIKGFASKPAGNAPSKQIVEINEHMARMQKLAGITKY